MHHIKIFIILAGLLTIGFVGWRHALTDAARTWFEWRMLATVPIIAIGLFAPNVWIYYAAILAAMLLLPRNRVEAAGLYILLTFLLPLTAFDWSIGSTPMWRLQANHIAALGLLPAFRFPGERGNQAKGITIAVLLLTVTLIILSSRLASVTVTSVGRQTLAWTLSFALPYFLISTAGGRDIRRLLTYLVSAGFMLAIVSIFEMTRHWPLYQSIDANLDALRGVSRTLALRGGLMRAAASFSESTSFGLFLAVSAGVAFALPSIFRSRTAWLLVVTIIALGCFTSLSRNSWICLFIAVVSVWLYRGRIAAALGVGGLAALAGLALLTLSSGSSTTGALLGKGNTTAASTATYRSDLLRTSIPFIKRNPILGTPVDQLREAMRETLRSRDLSVDWVNTYLYFLTVGGVISLAIYLFFILRPLRLLGRARAKAIASQRDLEALSAIFAGLLTFAVAMFGTSFSERLVMLSVILTAAARLAINQAGRGAGAPSVRTAPSSSGALIVDPVRPTSLIPI